MTYEVDNINTFIEEDDVAIVVRPVKEDGKWTGEVSVALADCTRKEDGDLNEVQQEQLLHIGAMVAASMPMMMMNDDVYDMLDEYATVAMEGYDEDEDEDDAIAVERNGNVYTLSFNSKTEGSA